MKQILFIVLHVKNATRLKLVKVPVTVAIISGFDLVSPSYPA